MMTKTTIPAGFTERTVKDDLMPDETYTEWNGPVRGNARAYWSPEQGVVIALDGYAAKDALCGPIGVDLTPETARQVIADLSAVLEALER